MLAYLKDKRGFLGDDAEVAASYYGLLYSNEDSWNQRIIFPIYMDEKLLCWTGRSIRPDAELRYLSLSHKSKDKSKGQVAVRNIKDTLWNYDDLIKQGGKRLYLVEGPFDALKLDFYAKPYNIRATCLFNNQISDAQAGWIAKLSKKFEDVRILFDTGAMTEALRMQIKISGLISGFDTLPNGVKDPGDLNKEQIYSLIQKTVSVQ
jgi:hypothetical protein